MSGLVPNIPGKQFLLEVSFSEELSQNIPWYEMFGKFVYIRYAIGVNVLVAQIDSNRCDSRKTYREPHPRRQPCLGSDLKPCVSTVV